MPAPESNPTQEIYTQLTAEQIAELQAQQAQAVDPNSPEAQAMATVLPAAEMPLTNVPQDEQITRAQAVEQMAAIEHKALNDTPAAVDSDAFRRTEETQKNQFVQAARKNVEEAFGSQAVEEATEQGIKESNVVTRNAHEIATAVAHNKTTLESEDSSLAVDSRDVASKSDTQKQYAELKDKVNGDADHITGRVAKRARHYMHKFGISKREQDLKAEIVETVGAEITHDKESKDAEQALVGEALVASLVDNKPRLKDAARKELIENLKNDSATAKDLGNALSYYRRGGRSLKSFRRVGRRL